MATKDHLISKLKESDIIRFGDFTLKSGQRSNVYFNMRNMISNPQLLRFLADYINKNIDIQDSDIICGIPMGALPIATALGRKMIMIRSDKKAYGLGNQIEGEFKKGDSVILVEDVITTGQSVYDAAKIIVDHGLTVRKIICILDRESEKISELSNFRIEPVLRMSELIAEREYDIYDNPIANRIYNQACKKKSNIILSCDLQYSEQILRLIEQIGSKIVGVKLHTDIIKDFNDASIAKLLELKRQFSLVLIEDRKFADITSTVLMQLDGQQRITEWADAITLHSIAGHQVISAIGEKYPHLAVILIAEMSSADNMISADYTRKTIEIARKYRPQIAGLVAQNINLPDFLVFSPGISLTDNKDQHNQRYTAINDLPSNQKLGSIWIVGRAIYNAKDAIKPTDEIRSIGWKHFCKKFCSIDVIAAKL